MYGVGRGQRQPWQGRLIRTRPPLPAGSSAACRSGTDGSATYGYRRELADLNFPLAQPQVSCITTQNNYSQIDREFVILPLEIPLLSKSTLTASAREAKCSEVFGPDFRPDREIEICVH